MKKLKIVHICSYLVPGLGYQEPILAREQVKLGHDVIIVASDRYYPFPDYDNTVKSVLGNRIVGVGEYDTEDGYKVIRLGILFEVLTLIWLKSLVKTMKRLKPDLVICHGISTINAYRITKLKNKLGYKLILDDHMLFSVEKKDFISQILYSLFPFKEILKAGDKLIGVSTQTLDYMVYRYKFPREKLSMVPLGADADLFIFQTEKRKLFREKYKITNDVVLITYTGKLTLDKGPHNIILALEKLKSELKEKIVLLFVGGFAKDYKPLFDSTALKIKGNYDIIIIPPVPNSELPMIYSATDIAVWPREASMSMIEAASCSVPIICCDYLDERYKNGNGLPIIEDDIDDLADKLKQLITNPDLRHIMGFKGRELIEKELAWSIIAKQFII